MNFHLIYFGHHRSMIFFGKVLLAGVLVSEMQFFLIFLRTETELSLNSFEFHVISYNRSMSYGQFKDLFCNLCPPGSVRSPKPVQAVAYTQ